MCFCVYFTPSKSNTHSYIYKKKNIERLKQHSNKTWVICRIVSYNAPKNERRTQKKKMHPRSSSSNPSAHVRNTITFFLYYSCFFAELFDVGNGSSNGGTMCFKRRKRKSVVDPLLFAFHIFLFFFASPSRCHWERDKLGHRLSVFNTISRLCTNLSFS